MKTKRTIILTMAAIFAVAGVAMLLGCSTFGSAPAGAALQRIQLSPQYDAKNQRFDNPSPGVLETLDKVKNPGLIFDFLFVDGERTPKEPMPQLTPDIAEFAASTGPARAIWFGHSTLLLRMAQKNILIDPVFSSRASPVPFTVGRYQDPALDLTELPDIDYIVISHDHYDHLDMKTVKFFADKRAQFLVPLGVGSYLIGWGIDKSRITELDWWGHDERGELEFVCTPARHFSGRGMRDKNPTLWASWVIRTTGDAENPQSLYYSGDSGYGQHFRQIGDAYGPFDAAFIETGQYNARWSAVHMLPREASQAYYDLKAHAYIPVHWAMFELSMHTWYQPGMEISQIARERAINLITPRLGEDIRIDETLLSGTQGSAWWQPWVDPSRPPEWYAQKVN